jgi:hypothetical protein
LLGGGERGQEIGLLEDDADLVAAQVGEFAATASRLDLPEPEGPTTAVRLPLGTSRVTWSRAVRLPSPSG